MSAPDCWRIAGRLDHATVTALAAAGAARLRAGSGPLEIDLTDVGYANSAGLALLLEWLDLAQAAGRPLVYRQLPESLRRLAAVSNLDALLPTR